MKLGVHYNIFDGVELLPASIANLRKTQVDLYISVVYQKVSNFGETIPEEDLLTILKLKTSGLIDALYEYTPKRHTLAIYNEILKRNIGLELCKEVGCTHTLSMDADEFYIPEEFNAGVDLILDTGIDATYADFYNYVKSPTYKIADSHAACFVPFINKIYPDSRYHHESYHPVLIDPTRRITPTRKYWVFPKDTLAMHHMMFVRKDIARKYRNSTHNDDPEFSADELLREVYTFKPGKLFRGTPVLEVPNIFSIEL